MPALRLLASRLLLFPFLFLVAGCGSGSSEVTGIVYCNGHRLPGGTITFHSDSRQSSAEVIDGAFTMPNAPAGKVKVTVDVTPVKNRIEQLRLDIAANKNKPDKSADLKKLTAEHKTLTDKYTDLPVEMLDPDTTNLEYTITPGKHAMQINLGRTTPVPPPQKKK